MTAEKWRGSLAGSVADLLREYAEKVEAGTAIPPEEYVRRCYGLRARGLPLGLCGDLDSARDPALLRRIEACSDAQLADLARLWDETRDAFAAATP